MHKNDTESIAVLYNLIFAPVDKSLLNLTNYRYLFLSKNWLKKLRCAVANGHIECMKFLLKQRNYYLSDVVSVLECAIEYDQFELAKLIVENSVKTNENL